MRPGTGQQEPKPRRTHRRARQRVMDRENEERNRLRSLGGGQPDELGILQGQNGEQGNTTQPRNAKLGRSADSRPGHPP